jgi:DNA replication protein DnaC
MKKQVLMSECPQCLGSTWKRESVPDKRDPSRLRTVAVRCDCFLEGRRSSLLRAARIPERYSGGLDEYQVDFPGADISLAKARLAAATMVLEYPLQKAGLMFVGSVGIGKTHLAGAVLRELIVNKGASGLFYSYADLLTEIRNSYTDNGTLKYFKDEDGNRWETESQILNHVINVDVLLLDELGKVKASEWVLDKVREIIGGRYDKKGTTLITTNFPLDPRHSSEIPLQEKIGADMVSRLREMCHLVLMEGTDYRRSQKAVNLPDSIVGRV